MTTSPISSLVTVRKQNATMKLLIQFTEVALKLLTSKLIHYIEMPVPLKCVG